MQLKWQWTIPNILSLIRIALIPVFAVLYIYSDENPDLLAWSIGVLALSGATDLFDGYIARRFNQITEIGKVLDPVADKLTQVTVMLCLAINNPRLFPLFGICFVKELLQSIGAALLMFRKKADAQPARWYGKVATFVFYFCMALFVAFPLDGNEPLLFGLTMPLWLFITLAVIVAAFMIFAFIHYAQVYLQVSRDVKERQATPQADNADSD